METNSLQRVALPQHIAIIMDGNGRWAQERSLPRLEGHRAGTKSVRSVVEECRRLGIRYLTLFCFSTENWQREEDEVFGLMQLFAHYLNTELSNLLENNIRLRAIGDLERLPAAVQDALAEVISKTEHNTGLDFVLAISYGGREEILAATKKVVSKVQSGEITSNQVTSQLFASCLWTQDLPDPDLLIRTSGEMRISNFLLWQLAYAEIVVTPEYWPDFDPDSLKRCLDEYSRRERRFGLTGRQIEAAGQFNGSLLRE